MHLKTLFDRLQKNPFMMCCSMHLECCSVDKCCYVDAEFWTFLSPLPLCRPFYVNNKTYVLIWTFGKPLSPFLVHMVYEWPLNLGSSINHLDMEGGKNVYMVYEWPPKYAKYISNLYLTFRWYLLFLNRKLVRDNFILTRNCVLKMYQGKKFNNFSVQLCKGYNSFYINNEYLVWKSST